MPQNMATKNKESIQTLLNTFQIITWNVNGLQEGIKTLKVMQHLQKLSADIVLLQETHLKSGQIQFLKRHWVGKHLKLHILLEAEV